ncbi:MAG: hypothetical protein AAFN09_06085 [Pseudomonadota bacterium]
MMLEQIFPDIVAQARLAPSAHNTQPARWRLAGDRIEIHADLTRRLPVGDPDDRDLMVAIGAAVEGTVLALASHGIGATVKTLDRSAIDQLKPLAAVIPGGAAGAEDVALAPHALTRSTHRLGFSSAPPEALDALTGPGVHLVHDAREIADLARTIDRASAAILRDRAFREELLSWMRLSPGDSGYAIDGLNRETLGLGPGMARATGLVLGTGLYGLLAAMGLGPRLSGEAEVSAKASGVALMHWPQDGSILEAGRAFYRFWLEVSAAGLVAWPAAALADHPATASALHARFALPKGDRLYNALRLGRPMGETPSRTRLRAEDVMV